MFSGGAVVGGAASWFLASHDVNVSYFLTAAGVVAVSIAGWLFGRPIYDLAASAGEIIATLEYYRSLVEIIYSPINGVVSYGTWLRTIIIQIIFGG